jgi:hypothetical protein
MMKIRRNESKKAKVKAGYLTKRWHRTYLKDLHGWIFPSIPHGKGLIKALPY